MRGWINSFETKINKHLEDVIKKVLTAEKGGVKS